LSVSQTSKRTEEEKRSGSGGEQLQTMKQRQVYVIPEGQSIQNGTMLLIQEDNDLESFIARAAYVIWNGEKIGDRLYCSDGDEVLDFDAVQEGDFLYISEYNWIGNDHFLHFEVID
jgi:hypothetical protein